MPTFLLDTSVIIDTINNKKGRPQLLRDLLTSGNLLACCAINVTEIYTGVRPSEQSRTAAFLSTLEYYEITFAIARLAGDLKREFSKKGITLSVPDVLIAAVAIYHKLWLITDNTKDFPMSGLSLYPPPN